MKTPPAAAHHRGWLLAAWFACTQALASAPAFALHRWQQLPPTPQLPRPDASGFAHVNGIRLKFSRFGAGRPLLLLHGGLANSNYWGNVIPLLVAHHFEVIAPDSRGHGQSTRTSAPFTYDLMADDVMGLLDDLKLTRVDLVGWSDGGIIGLDLAMRHPERLHRLAVYGTNSDPSGTRQDFATNRVFSAYLARTRLEYQHLSRTPDDFDQFLRQIEIMWAKQPRYSQSDLAAIHTPVLVFDGAHDEAIQREHTEYLAHTIPDASLVFLDDVSHFGMLQNPSEFARTVVDFLLKEENRAAVSSTSRRTRQ